jgi:DNA-binding protein Fis
MINIVITKDEKKTKDIIVQLLRQEGYRISDELESRDMIRVADKDFPGNPEVPQEIVINLRDSLYKENRGEVYKLVLKAIEKPLLEHVLEKTEGNQLKAAKILGINRNTIRAKIKRFSIDVDRWKG